MTEAENIEPDAPIQVMTTKLMRLRYTGTCAACGTALGIGTTAEWHRPTKTVTCLPCVEARRDEPGSREPVPPALASPIQPLLPDPGEAGASARREYERRHQKRELRIEQKWGRLAPVAKFLRDDPQSTTAWAKGSDGERRLASHLQRALSDRAILLHDRKVPRTRGNIDHLAIAPSGIWVIDAKNYQGKVERRGLGWSNVDNRLYVAGRNRTRLVEGLAWQIDAVRAALGDEHAPIHAALCFTDATWKWSAKPFRIGNVWVTWADALAELIGMPGPLVPEDVIRIATKLGVTLPSVSPVAAAAGSS